MRISGLVVRVLSRTLAECYGESETCPRTDGERPMQDPQGSKRQNPSLNATASILMLLKGSAASVGESVSEGVNSIGGMPWLRSEGSPHAPAWVLP